MVDREVVLARYRLNRARSNDLFDLLDESAYYSRPIALRHPIVFYEGHLPAFSFNTLVKKTIGGAPIDPRLETLFARGIDPDDRTSGGSPGGGLPGNPDPWPSRNDLRRFAEEADARVLSALANDDLDRPERREALFTILEHEAMHQETLLYMWHRLPFEQKRRPADYTPRVADADCASANEWVDVPGGCATLGVEHGSLAFGWDNEFGSCQAPVPAFAIERQDVTNARFLEFVEAGGYRDERWWRPDDWQWIQTERVAHPLFWEPRDGSSWHWRGMFDLVELPLSWPVYVSYAEAAAYARWHGARLPSEAEYQRAAYGSPIGERPYPWGHEVPGPEHGVFNFSSWDPEPAGAHPRGASAWGVEDLVGNGWEWTSSTFGPFPGFQPMRAYPEYSADFFDGHHMVMKGASPVTVVDLLRPTFRNWFRPRYPYVYATFRCVR